MSTPSLTPHLPPIPAGAASAKLRSAAYRRASRRLVPARRQPLPSPTTATLTPRPQRGGLIGHRRDCRRFGRLNYGGAGTTGNGSPDASGGGMGKRWDRNQRGRRYTRQRRDGTPDCAPQQRRKFWQRGRSRNGRRVCDGRLPALDAGTGSLDASGSGGKNGADAGGSADAGTDGTTATGGISPGLAGTTTPAGCTAVPVTPNATQQCAQRALLPLQSIRQSHPLGPGGKAGLRSRSTTSSRVPESTPRSAPLRRTADGAATRCLTYWNAGGLCMFGYHMGGAGNRRRLRRFQDQIAGEIDKALTVGTNEKHRLQPANRRDCQEDADGPGRQWSGYLPPFTRLAAPGSGGAWREAPSTSDCGSTHSTESSTRTAVRNALWLLPIQRLSAGLFLPRQRIRPILAAPTTTTRPTTTAR